LQKDETILSTDSSKTFAANLEPIVDDRTAIFTDVAGLRTFEADTFNQGCNQGTIFMNFHSMTSSCLFKRGTTFSQTVTDMFFSQHFRKWELIRLNQAVTRGVKRSQHLKCFRPHGKMCWTCLKNLGPSQKTLRPL